MMKLYLYILILVFIILVPIDSYGQKSNFDYYRIEIVGQRNQLMELMNSRYQKEFYANGEKLFYVRNTENYLEIIEYNSLKTPTKYYVVRNDSLFLSESFTYVDENLMELSGEEQERIKQFYEINKAVKKNIYGFDCFQVIMQDPSGGSNKVEMFVTEDLPNLPAHFPLSSNVLNAEPLEIQMNLMGTSIKVGIVEIKKGVDIEKQLNLKFSDAIPISEEKLNNLKQY